MPIPVNKQPIFPVQGIGGVDGTATTSSPMAPVLTLAANDFNGAGANNALICTSPTVANGGSGLRIIAIQAKPNGTNVASVLRVFVNNGGTVGTPSNNEYLDDLSLPPTTATAASGTSKPTLAMPPGFVLRPGFRLYAGLGTAVAGGWTVKVIGGEY